MFHKLAAFAVVVILGVVGIGCNTMHGAGEDIQWTGEAVQDVTQRAAPAN